MGSPDHVKKPPDIEPTSMRVDGGASPDSHQRGATHPLASGDQLDATLNRFEHAMAAGPSRDREQVLNSMHVDPKHQRSSPPPQFSLPRRVNPASAAHLAPPVQSLAYSPWDVRLSPVEFSFKGKNKATTATDADASNPHDPADSLSPAATASPPAPSSVEFSSDDEMEREAGPDGKPVPLQHPAPIRIRRVGALGISVDSESTKEDGTDAESDTAPLPIGGNGSLRKSKLRKPRKSKRVKSLARTRDLADTSMLDSESKANTFDDLAPSDEVETAGGTKRKKKTKGISDSNYRAIVDDLTVENQTLKNRLRRYEGAHLPQDMKKERLFEVRWFEGLPTNRRDELASFLTHFVRKLHGVEEPRPLNESQATKPEPVAAVANQDPPRLLSLPAQDPETDAKPELPVPVIPDRKLVRHRRKRDEREVLAGPSNSGVEPPSLTGTGSGLQLDTSPQALRPAKKRKTDSSSPGPPRDVIDEEDEPRARELVHVVERLFSDSLASRPDPLPTKRKTPGTNEAYLGALLQNDDLSGGWTYLNLVSTMAQLHRFNVTAAYVQAAIRYYSKNLELSADGSKVRWVGPRPAPDKNQQKVPPAEMVNDKAHRGSRASQTSEDTSASNTSSSDAIFSEEKTTSGQASTAATTDPPQSVAPPPDKILRGHQPATIAQRIPGPPPQPSSLRHETKAADDPAGAASDDQARGSTDEVETSSNELALKESSEDSKKANNHQYVSFFTRWRKGHSTLRSSSSSSGNDSLENGNLEGGRPTGKVIFYSSVDFCSDLTQDMPIVSPLKDHDLPFPPLGAPSALHRIYGEANKSLVPELLDYDIDMDHMVPTSFDMIEDLSIVQPDEPLHKPLSSRRSSGPSVTSNDVGLALESFRPTGLAELDDFFTMIVTTFRPSQPSKLLSSRKQKLFKLSKQAQGLSFPLPLAPRPTDVRFVTISTEIMQHATLASPTRRPLLPHLLSSSSDSSGDESSKEESSDSPPLFSARKVPRAPSPDYLISLAMPFFSWSPRHQRPFSAAGAFWKHGYAHPAGRQEVVGHSSNNGKLAKDHTANGADVDHVNDDYDAVTGGAYSVLTHSHAANDKGDVSKTRQLGKRKQDSKDDQILLGKPSGREIDTSALGKTDSSDSLGDAGRTGEDTTSGATESDEPAQVTKRRKINLPQTLMDTFEAGADKAMADAAGEDTTTDSDNLDRRPIDLDESFVAA
ncbi:hypothetical protein OIO90_003462 [Microbotryomycetes sp. JL221]|nr:hypothetical protein OIO90_003462 [Microbotryomycetes sp. JL221]